MTSSKVKPESSPASVRPARNSTRAFHSCVLSVGTIGENVVGPMFAWRAIDIGMSPRVVRNNTTFQIWTIPCRRVAVRSTSAARPSEVGG